MHSAHSNKDWQKEKQFLTVKSPAAFSGPNSLWGSTSFPCLWKSKPILIFNSFYSNPYSRLLMFFKQINESNFLIPKRDKWYLHTTDTKELKKINLKHKIYWSQRKDIGWHWGCQDCGFDQPLCWKLERKEFSVYPQVCPSLVNIKLTWSMKCFWTLWHCFGLVNISFHKVFIMLFIMFSKESQHQNDLPPFIF